MFRLGLSFDRAGKRFSNASHACLEAVCTNGLESHAAASALKRSLPLPGAGSLEAADISQCLMEWTDLVRFIVQDRWAR